MSTRLNKYQIADLCGQYQSGASTYQLADKYGISQPAVYKLLKRRAIILRSASDARRKLMLNEYAFEQVTEESAYWIGFLMAVGTIIQRGPASVDIALALPAHDFSHLERFKAFLGSSHAITSTSGRDQTYRFAVRSKRLADTLATYGVVPGKTHMAKVIGLENNRDFWRGVIDGRGTLRYLNVGVGLAPAPRLELVGPEMLLEQFLMFVDRYTTATLEAALTPVLRPYRNTYRIAADSETTFSIVKILYENCSVALARKLEIVTYILGKSPSSSYGRDESRPYFNRSDEPRCHTYIL